MPEIPTPEVCPRCLLVGPEPTADCAHFVNREYASWNDHGEHFPASSPSPDDEDEDEDEVPL